MDYRLIALGVVNGVYSHSGIAMAMHVIETLDAPQHVIDDIEVMLYALREAETAE